MDDRNTVTRSDDRLAGFSSRVPGARVGAWYLRLSGTSMATPFDAATRA